MNERPTAKRTPISTRHGLVLAVMAAPIVWAIMHWFAGIPWSPRFQEAQAQSTSVDLVSLFGLDDAGFRWLLLQGVVLFPLLEEIIFRGGVQEFLLRKATFQRAYAGISLANLLTSIVFAAFHLLNQPPLWAAMVLLPSLVFGWAREASGGLLAPILLHMFYNAGFYLLFVNT